MTRASSTNLPVDADRIADDHRWRWRGSPSRTGPRRAAPSRRCFSKGAPVSNGAFEAAGLETRIDAAGNLIGRREGTQAGLGTIMLGSHSDTVPEVGGSMASLAWPQRSKSRGR